MPKVDVSLCRSTGLECLGIRYAARVVTRWAKQTNDSLAFLEILAVNTSVLHADTQVALPARHTLRFKHVFSKLIVACGTGMGNDVLDFCPMVCVLG